MNQSGHSRRRTPAVVAVALGILLAALMVYPWPQHRAEPIIAGVIPAPLFFWIIWTGLFVGYVAWIAYRWDPYAAVVRRVYSGDANNTAHQPGAPDGTGGGPRDSGGPDAGHGEAHR